MIPFPRQAIERLLAAGFDESKVKRDKAGRFSKKKELPDPVPAPTAGRASVEEIERQLGEQVDVTEDAFGFTRTKGNAFDRAKNLINKIRELMGDRASKALVALHAKAVKQVELLKEMDPKEVHEFPEHAIHFLHYAVEHHDAILHTLQNNPFTEKQEGPVSIQSAARRILGLDPTEAVVDKLGNKHDEKGRFGKKSAPGKKLTGGEQSLLPRYGYPVPPPEKSQRKKNAELVGSPLTSKTGAPGQTLLVRFRTKGAMSERREFHTAHTAKIIDFKSGDEGNWMEPGEFDALVEWKDGPNKGKRDHLTHRSDAEITHHSTDEEDQINSTGLPFTHRKKQAAKDRADVLLG